MSKIQKDFLLECIAAVKSGSAEKKRKFLETVELQIALKNYDPQVQHLALLFHISPLTFHLSIRFSWQRLGSPAQVVSALVIVDLCSTLLKARNFLASSIASSSGQLATFLSFYVHVLA